MSIKNRREFVASRSRFYPLCLLQTFRPEPRSLTKLDIFPRIIELLSPLPLYLLRRETVSLIESLQIFILISYGCLHMVDRGMCTHRQ